MLYRAVATVFHRFMVTGRTSPALMGCIREDRDEPEEYVVKLKGGPEMSPSKLVCEAAAAKLADYFGISHPQQALVSIDRDLAILVEAQEPEKADVMRKSIGTNFGTQMLSNLTTWPIDRKLSASQLDPASEIFAFDVLIQNCDRNFHNPNLGTVADTIYIYDHELAFSFMFDIFPNNEPWKVSEQAYWSQHVFFNELRRKALSLDNFIERLENLPINFFEDFESTLPGDWVCEVMDPIKTRLRLMSINANAFKDELVRRLA